MHVTEHAEHDLDEGPQLRREEATVQAAVQVLRVHAAQIVHVMSALLKVSL